MAAPLNPERWEQIKRLFFAASECEGAMRESLLAQETQNDPALREAVERVLSSASAATFFELPALLQVPVEEDSGPADVAAALPVLGCYRALRVIGIGGTSTVYEAVQETPRRTVALKVLKTSLASTSMQQRFEWESHILARLHHPAIAQVHAAGIQENGADRTPYFVMEHIPGAETITQFAAARALDRRQRLEIFVQVCDAVQHAHQQGIIHRDLKPGNILVGAGGQPKVIDFGVARVVTEETGFASVHTQPGQIIGTLAYMSPEQCGQDTDSLDTRTDIYSLGVVLYELLCGQLPHDVYGTALIEAVRMIREQPAPRLRRHDPSLRGDLETIVHKAMAKDPDRRYSSPAALAEDIARYLNREPIAARPPSGVYYLRKLVARNRAMTALLLLCVLLIVAFGIAMKVQRDVAVEARSSAESAEKRALINESHAQAEAARAKQVQDLLVDVFQLADPHDLRWAQHVAGDAVPRLPREMSARELLGRGAKRVLERSDVPPLAQAAVMQAIARSYLGLGVHEPAHELLDRALAIRRDLQGPDHEQVAVCLLDLAVLAAGEGDWKKGESLAGESVRILRSQPQVDRVALSQALSLLATIVSSQDDNAQAESLALEAISLRPPSGTDDGAFRRPLLFLLSQLTWARGDYAAAEKLAWEAIRLAPQPLMSPDVSDDFENLSRIYGSLGQRGAQEKAARYSVELALRTLPREHPIIGAKVSMLITALTDQGRTREAIPLCRQLVDWQRKNLGDSRSETAESLFQLGTLLANSGDMAAAVEPFRESVRIQESLVGKNHTYTLEAMSSLAGALMQVGKGVEAEAMARDVLERYRTYLPENRFRLSMSEAALGWMLMNNGDLPGARTHLDAAVLGLRDPASDQRELGKTLYLLATVVSDQGDEEAAEALYRESLALLVKNKLVDPVITMFSKAGHLEDRGDDRLAERRYKEAFDLLSEAAPKSPAHREAMARLGLVLARNGNADAAEPLLWQVVDMPGDDPAADGVRARALAGLGLALVDTGRAEEARPLLEDSLDIQTRARSPEPQLINETKSTLGRCRSELKDFEGAEQLLLESANALKKGLGSSHKRTRQAFAALVHCYEAWDENEKADAFRSAAALTQSDGSR